MHYKLEEYIATHVTADTTVRCKVMVDEHNDIVINYNSDLLGFGTSNKIQRLSEAIKYAAKMRNIKDFDLVIGKGSVQLVTDGIAAYINLTEEDLVVKCGGRELFIEYLFDLFPREQ